MAASRTAMRRLGIARYSSVNATAVSRIGTTVSTATPTPGTPRTSPTACPTSHDVSERLAPIRTGPTVMSVQ